MYHISCITVQYGLLFWISDPWGKLQKKFFFLMAVPSKASSLELNCRRKKIKLKKKKYSCITIFVLTMILSRLQAQLLPTSLLKYSRSHQTSQSLRANGANPSGKLHNPFWQTTQSLWASDTILLGKQINLFRQTTQSLRAKDTIPLRNWYKITSGKWAPGKWDMTLVYKLNYPVKAFTMSPNLSFSVIFLELLSLCSRSMFTSLSMSPT